MQTHQDHFVSISSGKHAVRARCWSTCPSAGPGGFRLSRLWLSRRHHLPKQPPGSHQPRGIQPADQIRAFAESVWIIVKTNVFEKSLTSQCKNWCFWKNIGQGSLEGENSLWKLMVLKRRVIFYYKNWWFWHIYRVSKDSILTKTWQICIERI